MPASVPPGFVSDASLRVYWVPAANLANPAAPGIAAALNAATSLDITCYLTGDFAPDADVATITDDRVCLKQVLEDMGAITWKVDDLQYIYDVQNAASISNKAYAGMTPGAIGYFVTRYGMDYDTAPATGQKVDVIPVKLGPQIKLPVTRNTKGRVRQPVRVNGAYQTDVALVA
ncbi:MAG TPA: hypothetical protein PLG46_08690 [Ornithinibacter sp.]|nr:hypothetical protein [Ornithinibacter sp.]